jgi:hypothetical protein
MPRPQKITFGEMRSSGIRSLLIYWADYHCSHWVEVIADRWPDDAACGKRGADVRPDFPPAKNGHRLVPDNGWQRQFDDPITLPRGRQLVTLEDAGKFITRLPKAEHEAPEMAG